MDNYDCWINDLDFKTPSSSSSYTLGFTSPGPSSGYCSAEESNSQVLKIGSASDLYSYASSHQRQTESPWRGDTLLCGATTLSSDPYLGETLIGGSGNLGGVGAMEDGTADFKSCAPSFDDLMDTLWDPLGETIKTSSDFMSCDMTSDVDMIDLNQLNSFLGGGQIEIGQRRGSSDARCLSLNERQSSLSGLSGSTASRSNVTQPSPLSKTVFNFHQHIAGLADMVVGDEEDYVLEYKASNNKRTIGGGDVVRSPSSSSSSSPQSSSSSSSALLAGVFSQRGSMPGCESKAFARIKGGAVVSSCGTLLRSSVALNPKSIPSGGNISASSSSARDGGGTPLPGRGNTRGSSNLHGGTTSCSRGDMKGGRSVASCLDDHRYTLKQMHSPPATKYSRTRKGSSSSNSSNVTSNGLNVGVSSSSTGKMSILEAFLRSTRPLDPNKGSNAALAAEGLSHLRLDSTSSLTDDESSSSGTILKKLLTGEIDQSEVRRCEERVILERMSCPALPKIESTLTDGFGLDADLVVDESDGNAFLPSLTGSDVDNGLWMDSVNVSEEVGLSTELEEILQEQTRQDELWLQYYINNSL